eukprot:Skav202364  [mRNA]  locus=scaffold3817:51085:52269:- [translate_table: standard]
MEVWIRRPKLFCTEKGCLAAHFSCRHETESDLEAGTSWLVQKICFPLRLLDANIQPHRQDPTKASNDFALDGVEHILLVRIDDLLVLLDLHEVLPNAFLI